MERTRRPNVLPLSRERRPPRLPRSPDACPPLVGCSGLLGRSFLRDCDLDKNIHVDRDQRLRPDPVDDDLDLSERRLDRGDAAPVGDGGCATSDEPATADDDLPTGARHTTRSMNYDGKRSLQEDVISQR